jgi:hypothetical protein
MQTDWQTWAALSIVAVAAVFVIRRFFFGGNSCGNCHGCTGKKPGAAANLVQLSTKKQDKL